VNLGQREHAPAAVSTAARDDGYTQLPGYVEREGNAKVPAAFITRDGFKRGLWVGTQRQRFKAGLCDPAQQKRLETLQAERAGPLQWGQSGSGACGVLLRVSGLRRRFGGTRG
jgi:hypothetical protein